MNENYILLLENKEGDNICLEGKVLEEINFPKLPLGGEKIILEEVPELIEYFRKRAFPVEELQRRFSNKTYVIEKITFDKDIFITANEKY